MEIPEFRSYEASNGEWRWRLVDTNGRIIADGAEGYDSEENVNRAIDNVEDAVVDIVNANAGG